ncbi:DUF6966 domain-containing protein [Micromonospora inositola]|uniref:DUF6966 domain-containing protein n=1 Tax=Micromonospora inositola TaxID=47865 RepID=A0A1C5IV34_9ACTN|nr:hypothetical protein [Micromonospora inositola]SCG62204.1 hypothetical protein GA0070613_3508 [Micromonospora inositola]
MKNNADRLHNLLLEVAYVLRIDEPRWSSSVAGLGRRLDEAGTDRHVRQRVVRDILGLYRHGMGGFQDVVLQRDGAVLPEQQQLDRLRSALFEESRRQLAGEPL